MLAHCMCLPVCIVQSIWRACSPQIDAYIFLSGSSGSTSTTVAFLYVLWRFPGFIRHVKAEGADPAVVVRLATFFQLNVSPCPLRI